MILGLALFVPASEVLNETWYRFQEPNLKSNPNWAMRWPEDLQKEDIDNQALDILGCDNSAGAGWADVHGCEWHWIYLRWRPENRQSMEGTGHLPEQCLCGAGWTLLSKLPGETITVNGIEMPFLPYIFEVDGRCAYVFVCVWENRAHSDRAAAAERANRFTRFRAAFHGERRLERRKIEVALIGPGSPEEALNQLKLQLQQIIQPSD